jgi:hypothetical protein
VAAIMAREVEMDTTQRVTLNRMSTVGMFILSAATLSVVLPLWYGMLTGHVPPPQGDEGTAAHVFQLCLALLFPAGLLFLATADLTKPVQALRPMALPALFVVLALGTVFYLENFYYASHGFPSPRPGLPLLFIRRLLAAFR